MIKSVLKKLHQRPIAYYPVYRKISGSVTAAVLLSQVLYWWSEMDEDVFYKSDSEFMKETGLSIDELKLAKSKLKKLDFLSTKIAGMPAVTYYSVDAEKLLSAIETSSDEATNKLVSKPPTARCQSHQQHNIVTENTSEKALDFSGFDQPEVASALWAEWVEYKKAQHGQKYKTVKSAQIQVNLLLKYSDGKSETAKQILELSMGNLYQGIIEPKQKSVAIKDGAVFSAAPPTPDDFPLTDDMQKRYDSTTSWFYKNCPSCTGVRWLSKKEFMSVMNRSEDLIPPMWYTKCPEDDFNSHVTKSISSLNAAPRWEKEKWPSIFEWLRYDLKIRIFGKKDNQ